MNSPDRGFSFAFRDLQKIFIERDVFPPDPKDFDRPPACFEHQRGDVLQRPTAGEEIGFLFFFGDARTRGLSFQ
jgi:hypothetical protein